MVDGRRQPVGAQPPLLGQQVPRQLDGAILEIIAEGEIPQHLEEGVVARGVADIVEVVVLAAGADAFLAAGRGRVGPRLEAGEDVLERHHAGVDEHQSRVVVRHQRRRRRPARARSFSKNSRKERRMSFVEVMPNRDIRLAALRQAPGREGGAMGREKNLLEALAHPRESCSKRFVVEVFGRKPWSPGYFGIRGLPFSGPWRLPGLFFRVPSASKADMAKRSTTTIPTYKRRRQRGLPARILGWLVRLVLAFILDLRAVGARLPLRAAAHHRDHGRRFRRRARCHQGLDEHRRDRPRHGPRRHRRRGQQILQPQRLRPRRHRAGDAAQRQRRPHPRRLDHQPADRQERLPVARRRLCPQGRRGLVHRADRGNVAQAPDHGGLSEPRRDRHRHLWRQRRVRSAITAMTPAP